MAVGGACVEPTATAATGVHLFNACRQLTLRYTKQNKIVTVITLN